MSRTPRTPLYFGCKNGPGHFVYKLGMSTDANQEWLEQLDGLLPPNDPEQIQGRCRLHHWVDRTLLAYWDRSQDKRRGCNSVFVYPKPDLSFAEIVHFYRAHFPEVADRLPLFMSEPIA